MSITGHQTTKEVTRYTRAADQGRLAKQAMIKLQEPKAEQKCLTNSKKLDKSPAKPLKYKGKK